MVLHKPLFVDHGEVLELPAQIDGAGPLVGDDRTRLEETLEDVPKHLDEVPTDSSALPTSGTRSMWALSPFVPTRG